MAGLGGFAGVQDIDVSKGCEEGSGWVAGARERATCVPVYGGGRRAARLRRAVVAGGHDGGVVRVLKGGGAKVDDADAVGQRHLAPVPVWFSFSRVVWVVWWVIWLVSEAQG